MSKDPLEELFGPVDPEGTAPTQAFLPPTDLSPQPARPQPPRSQQFPQEPATQPVPEVKKRGGMLLPWIIVAVVAIAALVGALVFVNMNTSKAGDKEPTGTSTEQPSDQPTTDAPSETPSEEPETPEVTEAPAVDVGETYPMEISYAGIEIQGPAKLNPNAWYVPTQTGDEVMFHAAVMGSFPDSCADMRSVEGKSPWGIRKEADGTWSVIRPGDGCAAAPELYNEVWGLMQAVADSAKPLEQSAE